MGELHGHVFLQQADGTKVPLADAAIDVFPDGHFRQVECQTDKKGYWVSLDCPTPAFTLWLPAILLLAPWQTNVKAGRDLDVVRSIIGVMENV